MYQAVGIPSLYGRRKDEVHMDMSESVGDGCATRANLARAADQCDQDQTDRGPYRFQSLTRSARQIPQPTTIGAPK